MYPGAGSVVARPQVGRCSRRRSLAARRVWLGRRASGITVRNTPNRVFPVSHPHPAPDSSFAEIVAGLIGGDQEAARRLYVRFVDDLVRLAGRRLRYQLGSRADPESVAHSAFESFFRGVAGGRVEVRNWGMVYGLLAHITFRKCLKRKRHESRVRRAGEAASVSLGDWEAAAAQTGPDEEAMLADLLETALAQFDPDERAVIDSLMQGATPEEVAGRVRLSSRTVYRVRDRFRESLEQLLACE